MENFVKRPFANHQANESWNYYVANKDKAYHMRSILVQGRADFTGNYQENENVAILSSTDMEILYRYYYFQFHYTSSMYVYEMGLNQLRPRIGNHQIVFIDIGCGPFTSGIAFKEFCVSQAITTTMDYHGYDIAQVMINSGNVIAQHSNNVHFETQNNFHLDYRLLNQLIIDNEKVIIVNICYFLSAHTLVINDFLDTMEAFFNNNADNQILIIYQNPKWLNNNWKLFKQRFKKFRTLRPHDRALPIQFDDIVGSWLPYKKPIRSVYFDYLAK